MRKARFGQMIEHNGHKTFVNRQFVILLRTILLTISIIVLTEFSMRHRQFAPSGSQHRGTDWCGLEGELRVRDFTSKDPSSPSFISGKFQMNLYRRGPLDEALYWREFDRRPVFWERNQAS